MNRRNSKIVHKRGFTLIELLLVLVILAVLAAIVIPKFTGRSQQARETAASTEISSFKTMIEMFEIDNGRFPSSLDELLKPPGDRKPYLSGALPKDPWGNEYQYKFPGQKDTSGYDVYSFGPDGRDATGDEIGNWKTK